MITAQAKHYQDTVAYGFDWREWLNEEDQILASWWGVQPSGLIVADYVSTADRTYVWLQGGTAGVTYTVTNTVTTVSGRTDQRSFSLPVRNLGSRIAGGAGVSAQVLGVLSDVPLFGGGLVMSSAAVGTLGDATGGAYVFTDDFNRADGALVGSAGWELAGGSAGINIVGNTAAFTGGNGTSATIYVDAGTLTSIGDGESYTAFDCLATTGNFYYLYGAAGALVFATDGSLPVYIDGGTNTGVSVSAGDRIELRVQGGLRRIFKNSVQVWSDTAGDPPYMGAIGFGFANNGAGTQPAIDNFEAGSL